MVEEIDGQEGLHVVREDISSAQLGELTRLKLGVHDRDMQNILLGQKLGLVS